MKITLEILFSFIFLLLQVIDVYLTRLILRRGGRELNPVFKYIGMLPGKIIVSILIVGAIFAFTPWVGIAPIILMVGVCIWNFIQAKK